MFLYEDCMIEGVCQACRVRLFSHASTLSAPVSGLDGLVVTGVPSGATDPVKMLFPHTHIGEIFL
jgi:hypothetical protein